MKIMNTGQVRQRIDTNHGVLFVGPGETVEVMDAIGGMLTAGLTPFEEVKEAIEDANREIGEPGIRKLGAKPGKGRRKKKTDTTADAMAAEGADAEGAASSDNESAAAEAPAEIPGGSEWVLITHTGARKSFS